MQLQAGMQNAFVVVAVVLAKVKTGLLFHTIMDAS